MYKNREQQIIEKWNEVYNRFKEGIKEMDLISQGIYNIHVKNSTGGHIELFHLQLDINENIENNKV